ncbi:LPXTG cell wall anchor domain-containing protein [Streptacidiphilus melanogenes]|uniref:LPXTG cell wall anchor domain-containing protein n=1 Tax=Streptacidiphilus melanogenes TaxID=411235 RepID=UPI0005A791DD|nr:LPXTG cell wall anchor domain-containing protein [Streptacidiphilus melanogenes]
MSFVRARGAVRFGAVAAAVLMSGGLTALPAAAAGGSTFAAIVSTADATLLPQTDGAAAQAFHQVDLAVIAEDAPLSGVAVDVDASGATGVVELSLPVGCSYSDAAKLHEHCALGSVESIGQLEIGMRSAAGAALGAKGTVRFTVTAANATVDKHNPPTVTTVTVGSGPDLAVDALPATVGVKPGQATPVNPVVRNVGDQAATGGVTLVLDTGSGTYDFGGGFGNCFYGGAAAVVCHFDTVIKPGQAYQLSTPVPLTAGQQAQSGDALLYGWDVKGGAIDTQLGGGTPGKGAPLTLVPAPAQPQAHTADINYDNNLRISELHLVSQNDLAAVAPHRITGTVGHTVEATFGVRNAGSVPTSVFPGTKDITAGVMVLLPKGVSVSALPKDCELLPDTPPSTQPGDASGSLQGLLPHAGFGAHAVTRASGAASDPSDPYGAIYACAVRQVLKPGAQAGFTFGLKATKALKQAPGLAGVVSAQPDNNPADDVAPFTVTATTVTATATPTPAGSAPASASPTTSATGGLAHTGGGSAALPLAAAGFAAVALGTGAVLLTRRRRRSGHA